MHYCCLHGARLFVSDQERILAILELEKEEYENLLTGIVSERARAFLLPFSPLAFENRSMAEALAGEFLFPNPAGTLARAMDSSERLAGIAMEHSRGAVTRASMQKDRHIVQAVSAISEMDETVNLLSERMREWFSLHYPELSRETRDNVKYAELISMHGERTLFPSFQKSMGGDIDDEDEASLRLLARTIVEVSERRETLSAYVNAQSEKVAPNLTHLLGGIITARLIACAGGLRELAHKPSSTVQLLGAEKALFRHLKTGADPPKHGILFQYPPINSAPWWLRGKMARMVASKVAILAKVDYFGGGFVADAILEDVTRKIEELKARYPQPSQRERTVERKVKNGRLVRGRKKQGREHYRGGRRHPSTKPF